MAAPIGEIQYADQESGLVQNWNRFYDHSIGRELEPDPMLTIGPTYLAEQEEVGRSAPVYAYVANNPIIDIDPTGMYSEMCSRGVLGVPDFMGAKHCYVRFDGDSSSTASYWAASLPTDPYPSTGNDLAPNAPNQCTKICDPKDPTCSQKGTDFDKCMKFNVLGCKAQTYDLVNFNCCDCVAQAIKKCGGSIPGSAWPLNHGWNPNVPPSKR